MDGIACSIGVFVTYFMKRYTQKRPIIGKIKYSCAFEKVMPLCISPLIEKVMFFRVTEANPASKPTNALKIKVKFFSETCLYFQIKKRFKSDFFGILL